MVAEWWLCFSLPWWVYDAGVTELERLLVVDGGGSGDLTTRRYYFC
ncbi:hypothetical protein Hanom_Chr07g00590241 [Helianthus anomalus]